MADLNVNSIGDASGGNTTTINGYTPTVSNMAGRNLIHNGAMQVAQRGTSFSDSVTGSTFDLDRFNLNVTSGLSVDCTRTQEQDAPENTGLRYSFKVTPNATNTPTGGQNFAFIQGLEGYTVEPLAHGSANPPQATLSFWVKSNKTGTYGLQIKEEYSNEVGEQYILFSYTINSSDTWEYKTVTWTGNSNNTLNVTNGQAMRVIWHLDSGPDDKISPSTTWTSSTTFQTVTGQASLLDSTANYWQITGVQLEVGSVATPFEHREYGAELQLCQRYFQLSGMGYGQAFSSATVSLSYSLPVTMRANPAVTYVNGTNGLIRIGGSNESFSSVSPFVSRPNFVGTNVSGSGYGTLSNYLSATTGSIAFSAEL